MADFVDAAEAENEINRNEKPTVKFTVILEEGNESSGQNSPMIRESNEDLNESGKLTKSRKMTGKSKLKNSTTTQNAEEKKSNEKTTNYTLQELYQKDNHGRGPLHRNALDLNEGQLNKILMTIEQTENRETQRSLVNMPDNYGNTPLLLACITNISSSEKYRPTCLNALLNNYPYLTEVDVNARNRRTLWTPIHWVAHYGNLDCLKILLLRGAKPFYPDHEGLFPLDLAGRQRWSSVVEALLDNLLTLFEDYFKEENQQGLMLQNKTMKYGNDARYLDSFYLRTSMLYWACFYPKNESYLLKILTLFLDPKNQFRVILEMPLPSENYRSGFHACCLNGDNSDDLKTLFDNRAKYQDIWKKQPNDLNAILKESTIGPKCLDFPNRFPSTIAGLKARSGSFNLRNNIIFCVSDEEERAISKSFKRGIRKLEAWIIRFFTQFESPLEERFLFDEPDANLNTPLHQAAQNGAVKCCTLLLENGSLLLNENMEGWLPFELNMHKEIEQRFDETFDEIRKHKENNDSAKGKMALGKRKLGERYKLTEEMRNADFVLVLDCSKKDAMARFSKEIAYLINSKVNVQITPSIEEDTYLLMLSMSIEDLQQKASDLKIQINKANSYFYEVFDHNKKIEYEPFRSRQRQEILFQYLNQIIQLDALERQGFLKNYYLMHFHGGIQKIKSLWMKSNFPPQPLASWRDYFLENEHSPMTSIACIRNYLGEKIGFYFAWASFYTCMLVFVAIPGLILQIYILATDSPSSRWVPMWVFYVSIWSTLVVEMWKRKNAEIAANWGVLKFMNDQSLTREVRKEFVGHEYISEVTGEVSNYYNHRISLFWRLAATPVLLIMMGLVIGTITASTYFQQINPDSLIVSIIAGSIGGVSITVLNIAYTWMSRWFVDQENHKFTDSHENSLIIKSFGFKFINSFTAIMYVAFIQQKEYDTLFQAIAKLFVTKQVSYLLCDVVIPWGIYKWAQAGYFKKIHAKARIQERDKTDDGLTINITDRINGNPEAKEPQDHCYYRAVVDCAKGIETKQWNLDDIEQNNLRFEYLDTVDYYSEMVIQFGFITMFAAAFPLGPSLAIISNIIELQLRVFTHVHVLERPLAEKAGGIGLWLDIWEKLSIFAVLTNFMLLYLHEETLATVLGLFSFDLASNYKLWIYLILEHFVMLFKFVFSWLIPDKPKWVSSIEERNAFLETKDKDLVDRNVYQRTLKDVEDLLKKEKQLQKDSYKTEARIRKYEELEKDLKRQLKIKEAIENWKISKGAKDKTLEQRLTESYMKYVVLDRELMAQRIRDVNLHNEEVLCLCIVCRQKHGTLICDSCKDPYCAKCFKETHASTGFSKHNAISMMRAMTDKTGSKPLGRDLNKLIEGNMTNSQITLNHWVKFEPYSFTQRSADSIKKFYGMFDKYYCIKEPQREEDICSLIPIDFVENEKILQNENFVVEEKLWFNRVLYMLLRRKKMEVKFEDVSKQLAILMTGSFEKRLATLLDILDEDGDDTILLDNMRKLFNSSFMQCLASHMMTVNKFMETNLLSKEASSKNLTRIHKKDAHRRMKKESMFRSFLEVLLQCKPEIKKQEAIEAK